MRPNEISQGTERAFENSREGIEVERNAPDPEECDLDDLDDLLDEFSAKKTDGSTKIAAPEDKRRPEKLQESSIPKEAAEAFNKQLQEQMAALMGKLDESPAMQKDIEAIMHELGTTADAETSSDVREDARAATSAHDVEEPFQETIRKTMQRMQASGEQATAAAKSDDAQNILTQMMKEMQDDPLEGVGGDEGFNKILMGMMEQLTNKEILYEPMKELHDKYPAWMEKNKAVTKSSDLRRYVEQQRLVQDIVARFEKHDYSDDSPGDREFIVERMQQMQAAGSPPADLVGDMQDALGDLESGCTQQ